jgi:predicted MFS family arabinose efflux permease
MFHNTLQTKATEMAPQARSTAIAVFAFSLFMGQASGVAACGLLISAVGYQWSFVLAGVSLLALGQWFSGRVRSHAVRNSA